MTMLLGDLGARVIKVEGPDGDGTRSWGPPFHEGMSTYFKAINRNKDSVVLDLHDNNGQSLAFELATQADILVENLRPGRMGALGLDYETLAALNPGLIYCSISGFGSQPDGANVPGYDLLAQAAGGLMSITGEANGEPVKVGVAVVDVLCGLHAAVAVLSALEFRNRTGRGQLVEVDLMSSVLSALTNQASGYLLAGVLPTRAGNAHPSVVPYEVFDTMDGSIVIAVGNDRQFHALALALNAPHLAEDPKFSTNELRVLNRTELVAKLAMELRGLTRMQAEAALRLRGVPVGPVNDVAEAFKLADSIGLDPTWTVGSDTYVRAPFRLHSSPPVAVKPAPSLDKSGEDIREWLRSSLASRVAQPTIGD